MSVNIDSMVLLDQQRLRSLPQEVVLSIKELASLPQTLVEVLRVTKDEEQWAVNELVTVLMRDPALTEKVLRIANSPLYGAMGQIITMSQAVMTLGIRTVRSLALSSSIYDMSGKWSSTLSRVRFWKHSLQVAITSRIIAEEIRYKYPEEVFICGLLHDIGILLLEQSSQESFHLLWKKIESLSRLSYDEILAWRELHSSIGRTYLKQWNIPPLIYKAVGDHHNYNLMNSSEPETLPNRIIALADLLSHFTITPFQEPLDSDAEFYSALVASLNLSTAAVENIEKRLITQTVEEAKFLEMDIGSQEEILMEANRVIYKQYLNAATLLCNEGGDDRDEIAINAQDKVLQDANDMINHERLKIGRLLREKRYGEKNPTGQEVISLDTTKVINDLYIEMDGLLAKTSEKLQKIEELSGKAKY